MQYFRKLIQFLTLYLLWLLLFASIKFNTKMDLPSSFKLVKTLWWGFQKLYKMLQHGSWDYIMLKVNLVLALVLIPSWKISKRGGELFASIWFNAKMDLPSSFGGGSKIISTDSTRFERLYHVESDISVSFGPKPKLNN